MSSGPILALELEAEDAIAKWRALIGPTNSETARKASHEASPEDKVGAQMNKKRSFQEIPKLKSFSL